MAAPGRASPPSALGQAAASRGWNCPRCTLNNAISEPICAACGYSNRRRAPTATTRRPPPPPVPRTPGAPEAVTGMVLRAAIAGAAGLALGRASTRGGLQRAAVTALAVAAVPLANMLVSRLLGPPSSSSSSSITAGPSVNVRSTGGGPRDQRRRQLLRAAQQAADEAEAAGSLSAEEQALLRLVMQPAESRTERVRTIARVLEWLQRVEAQPGPRSRSTQLVSALVVYELNSLVDEMDYEELHQAFGGHPPAKGLDAEQVAALPSVVLSPSVIATLHSPTCSVCLDGYEAGQTARVLPACSHAFHAACLDPWLLSKAVCPVCRAQVEPPASSAAAVGASSAAAGTGVS